MPSEPLRLDVLAPLSGILVPLETVPDPVFAQKMAGDGLSLDPLSSEVLAPVSGVISQLHPACHALAVASGGVEVLVHVGIDTVTLKGRWFTPLVRKGDTETLARLNTAIASIKADGTLDNILNKWGLDTQVRP